MRPANGASVHFTLSRATQDEPRSRFARGLPFSFPVLRTCVEATGQRRNGDHGNGQTDEHTHSFSTRKAGIRWESRVRRPPLRIPSRACNRTDEHTAHRGPAPRYRCPPRCRTRLRRRAERSGRKVHRWGPYLHRRRHPTPRRRSRASSCPGRKSRLELALPAFSARHMPRLKNLPIWPSQRRVWCSRDT